MMTSVVSSSVRIGFAALIAASSLVWFAQPDRAGAQGSPAQKEDAPPPATDDGRYTFHRIADGFVRLDSHTGQVARCGWIAATWSCKMAPDERAALESEITRLQRDNVELKKSLLSRGIDLPSGMLAVVEPPPVPPTGVPDPSAREPQGPKALSEADLDRAYSFVKNAWRRLVDMMADLQRDMQRSKS
jgi:hypothetical protein